jgi:hypothetical protein
MLSPAALTAGAVALTVAASLTAAASAPDAKATPPTARATAADAAAQQDGLAQKPYMGWSSWSMQSSKYPGLNPTGDYSYLTEANVLKQADAMANASARRRVSAGSRAADTVRDACEPLKPLMSRRPTAQSQAGASAADRISSRWTSTQPRS